MKVKNWGNFPEIEAELFSFKKIGDLRKILQQKAPIIARGLGRSYGDSSLASNILSTLDYDSIINFDQEKGKIHCQAGVSFEQLLEVIIPKGWFLPVTPGTKFITVGGAIAADVHGKNQHKEGNFCNHVIDFEIMLENGEILKCSRNENEELFWMTCGGMGLTGVILNATIQLKPIETVYIKHKAIKVRNIEEMVENFEKYRDWTYVVAWIDCLAKGDKMGKGIILLGEHATLAELDKKLREKSPLKLKDKRKISVPFYFPEFVLNSFTVKTFNFLYYSKQTREKDSIIDYDSFFYPLDAIYNWNKIYGRKGFTQYQFVVPLEKGLEALKKVLEKISENKFGSFLAVLKQFGKQNKFLSFPMEGYTLALDFPIRPGLFSFFEELDKIVLDYGGKLYLAKDARMSAETFIKSYSEYENFFKLLSKYNPNMRFNSLQFHRLGFKIEK